MEGEQDNAPQNDEEKDNNASSSSSSSASPFQEYFHVPENLQCAEILASLQANVAPVYKPNHAYGVELRSGVKRNSITQIKNLTRRPPRSVPVVALNTWNDMTPDQKLPDIRHKTDGDIYYSRGKLCQKLNQKHAEFDLRDPHNQQKVPYPKGYSSLHDPHCRSYFKRPTVVKHLQKQNLINRHKEVLCNVHEFNHYRSYLGTIFNDKVKHRIDDKGAMKDMERGLQKSIVSRSKQSQLDAKNLYQIQHIKINSSYRESKKKIYLANIKNWEKRLAYIDSQKTQRNIATAGMHTMKHWNAYITRIKAGERESNKKKSTLIRIAYTEIRNDYVTKYDKFVRLALFERYKADQAAVMVARDDQIDDMEELVEETLKRESDGWLRKYDTFINRCRENLAQLYEHPVLSKATMYLMNKYYRKWIEFVIKMRLKRLDVEHASFFEVDKHLKPFVNDLQDLSSSNYKSGSKRQTLQHLNDGVGLTSMEMKFENLAKLKRRSKPRQIPAPLDKDAKNKVPKKCVIAPKILAGPGDGDGHDAAIDADADDYINKVIARFQMDQDLLKERLAAKAPRVEETRRYTSLYKKGLLNDKQLGHRNTIGFLGVTDEFDDPS